MLRGRRLVVVGFVHVESPRVDRDFVQHGALANTSAVGGWADHECVGGALLTPPVSPRIGEECGGGHGGRRRRERGGDGDLAGHLFGE